MVLSTDRKESASKVSSRRGSARGRPAGPARGRFICRWTGSDRGAGLGEFEGEADIRSSERRSSSSAFRFREPVIDVG